MTCRPDAKSESSRAGVCLACSYSCHDGHELVELYTKRNFRCDCGNGKFEGGRGDGDGKCRLMPHKENRNPDNCYNQNYDGVYCTCSRPYPDPDDTVEDEMIQCVVCEDWYHSRHLRISQDMYDGKVPEEYHEMICHLCAAKHPFLSSYASRKDEVVDVTSSSATDATPSTSNGPAASTSNGVEASDPNLTCDGDGSRKRKRSGEDTGCRLKRVKKSEENLSRDAASSSSALFFDENWRSTLCACAGCQRVYEEGKISFLSQLEDSVSAYEGVGGEGEEEEEEAALGNLLGGMDRFQQGELLAGYAEMRTSLNDFLRGFAEQGKVVKAEDIRHFFEEMEAKKKAKGNPQYFCG